MEYSVAWYLSPATHDTQKIRQLFKSSIPQCQITSIKLVKDPAGSPLDAASGLGKISYNPATDFLEVERSEGLGFFNLFIEGSNADSESVYYPI